MLLAPNPMHIPDGFLSIFVSMLLWLLAVLFVGISLKRVDTEVGEKKIPMMGVMAAAIFSGQMLNFAVAGGTSGHLMGAALATILLGPWAAILVITSVVSIQALIFQDGGLLALGANIFNMGVVGVAVAYTSFSTIKKLIKNQPFGLVAAGFAAGWLSIVIASLGVALQLAVSGTAPANITIPTMGGVHALIGVGEGFITIGALMFIQKIRPDLLKGNATSQIDRTAVWVLGLLLAFALAILSPMASSRPDGLEWVAEQQGFLNFAQQSFYNIIPDYIFPGISNEAVATIAAGVIGSVIVFLAFLIPYYFRKKPRKSNN